MRFLRMGPRGAELPAVGDTEATWYDLTSPTGDVDPAFLAGGGRLRTRLALATPPGAVAPPRRQDRGTT